MLYLWVYCSQNRTRCHVLCCPVTAFAFAWYPSGAEPGVARQTLRCKPSDLVQESQVTEPSTGETELY